MRERLTSAIDDLPGREHLVMTLYYEEMTIKETGLILGVVESRVSRFTPLLCCTSVPQLATPSHAKNSYGAKPPSELVHRHDGRNSAKERCRNIGPRRCCVALG
jgi:hypothetical protein